MSIRILGFVGVDKYEIINYVARVFCNLEKKVLLIDHSELQALSYSLQLPYLLREDKVECRKVDFIADKDLDDEVEEDYDYILIDFGFRVAHKDIPRCQDIYVVCDLQRHHVERLASLNLTPFQHRFLILKHVIDCKITSSYIRMLLDNLCIIDTNCYTLYEDWADFTNQLNCQYNHIFRFKNATKILKNMLYDIVTHALEDNEKEIHYAFRLAERGR